MDLLRYMAYIWMSTKSLKVTNTINRANFIPALFFSANNVLSGNITSNDSPRCILCKWSETSLPSATTFVPSSIVMLAYFTTVSPSDVRCRTTFSGTSYRGYVNVTTSELPCQRWNSQSPHSHIYNLPSKFPDATLDEVSNHCRNPSADPTVWCYTTTSLRWNFCAVPMCEGKCKVSDWISYEQHGDETKSPTFYRRHF